MIKKVFTRKIAINLINKGFNCIGTETNKRYPWLQVYLFNDNQQFTEEFNRLSNRK